MITVANRIYVGPEYREAFEKVFREPALRLRFDIRQCVRDDQHVFFAGAEYIATHRLLGLDGQWTVLDLDDFLAEQ